MSSTGLEMGKGGPSPPPPAKRVRGSDRRVQPRGVVGLGQHKHRDEAGERGRPGHPTGPLASPGYVAGPIPVCPQSPTDMSLAKGGAERMSLAPWSWGLGGGGPGSWVVCVQEETLRAYLVISVQ